MSAYLATLDALLAAGLAAVPRSFLDRQARFIEGLQGIDGGFRGRRGDSDLYYTDFAVRVLVLCAPDCPALARVPAYLDALPPSRDIIQAFNWLNVARLLRRPLPEIDLAVLPPPDGAYRTFLMALCRDLLGQPVPDPDALLVLRRDDGGFSERPGERQGQTNATAAALGALTVWGISPVDVPAALRCVAGMQAADGGLRAHAGIGDGDLLSTFTGLLTLSGLGDARAVRLGDLGRFVQRLAALNGGFRAALVDDSPDAEYTYYGLGTLALLYQLR
jgi:geranylgeranyl transferase type-2 subunit beta